MVKSALDGARAVRRGCVDDVGAARRRRSSRPRTSGSSPTSRRTSDGERRNRVGGAYSLTVVRADLPGHEERRASDRGAAGRRRQPARPARRAALLAHPDLRRARATRARSSEAATDCARASWCSRARSTASSTRTWTRSRAGAAEADAWWEPLRRLPRHAPTARRSRAASARTRSTAACSPSAYPDATVAGRAREPGAARADHRLRGRRPGPRRRRAAARAFRDRVRADAARAAAEPPAPAAPAARDRPRRHPGQRAARLHVPVRGVPVPAHRRRRPRAGADDADAAAGQRPPSRGATARRRPRCTSRSPTPGSRRSACPQAILDSFPDEFREGMAARAERLGDRGPSAPEHWEAGLGTGEAHVLVTVYARRRRAARRGARGAARRRRRGRGRRSSTSSARRRSRAARDHFGFFDGIAQPAIAGQRRGAAARRRPAGRRAAAGARSRPASSCSATRTRTARLPEAPAAPFDRNGTFVVYRKLRDGRRRVPALRRRARRALPGRPGAAGGQDRRPLARRHAARASRPTGRTPALAADPAADQRLLATRDDPRGPALPARRAHPPRQPARRARASSTAGSPTATASSAAAAPTARRCPPA